MLIGPGASVLSRVQPHEVEAASEARGRARFDSRSITPRTWASLAGVCPLTVLARCRREAEGVSVMSLQEVSNSVRFADREREVLARWERERTFQRSIERRAGAPRFVFYDGPPFATGLPHYGHILTSFIKDVVPRYQTMRGYCVPRRWGWDCHGLPVELEAERALELASPAEIARYGVGPFNDTCRALVTRHAAEWEQVMARLGRWVDFDRAYRTM